MRIKKIIEADTSVLIECWIGIYKSENLPKVKLKILIVLWHFSEIFVVIVGHQSPPIWFLKYLKYWLLQTLSPDGICHSVTFFCEVVWNFLLEHLHSNLLLVVGVYVFGKSLLEGNEKKEWNGVIACMTAVAPSWIISMW